MTPRSPLFIAVVIVLFLAVPLAYAQQPTVGLSYSGAYPLRPAYVVGSPDELAAQFNVGNSGTELSIVDFSVTGAPAELSVQISANGFQLASGERRDLTILFPVTNTTAKVYELTLTILMSQANPPQNVTGIGRASFNVPVRLDLNTTDTIQLTERTRIPIPEFNPLVLTPLILLAALLILRGKYRERMILDAAVGND